MTAITVTASEASAVAWYMRVLVLTGATAAGGAHVLAYGSTPSNPITPNGNNSLIVWAIENSGSNSVPSPATSNTALDGAAGSQGDAYTHGYYSGTVTSGTPVTVGCTSGSGAQMSAYEVLASGGSTPVRDASAPALATAAATSVTSASFTPPAGSVVTALIACYDTAGSITLTVSDSSSMTWTQRAFLNNFSQGFSAVYTATVPAAAAAAGMLMAGIV
jgi:hypothetical protein